MELIRPRRRDIEFVVPMAAVAVGLWLQDPTLRNGALVGVCAAAAVLGLLALARMMDSTRSPGDVARRTLSPIQWLLLVPWLIFVVIAPQLLEPALAWTLIGIGTAALVVAALVERRRLAR